MKKVKILGIIVVVAILVINFNFAMRGKQLVSYSLENIEAFAQSESSGVSIIECYKKFYYEVEKDKGQIFYTKCGAKFTYPTIDGCTTGYASAVVNTDYAQSNIAECVKS